METSPHAELHSGDNRSESPARANTRTAANDSARTVSLSRRKFLLATGTGTAAIAALGGIPVWNGLSAGSDRACEIGTVIDPPLRGTWLVMNPPGHPALADDFIGMRSDQHLPYPASSVPRHVLHTLHAAHAYGWGRPVYAPVGGTVLEYSNDEPDRAELNLFGDALSTLVSPPGVKDGNIRPAAGNYVVIEANEGIAFLAHLRQGSVPVADGTNVVPGQLLGEVGNSGASLFPHLHFQLMTKWVTDMSNVEETLLPYRFSRYERRTGNLLTGHSWEPVKTCVPAQREQFRVAPNDDDEFDTDAGYMRS